jgi:microcystin-dependent protein
MEIYLGTIILFAGNYEPMGFMFCMGQILNIAQNQALFAVIGNVYGGDGVKTFALPDLRGRVPVGTGQGPQLSPVQLAATGGTESVALTMNQMPAHSHKINAASAPTASTPIGHLSAPIPGDEGNAAAFGDTVAGTMANNAVSVEGQGQAHENRQPFLGLNYIIAVQGLFPPRQ